MASLKMVIIKWINSNGYEGHGSPISEKLALEWIEYLNKEYPDMQHWTEEVVADN